jgi:hypothetical protein
LVSFELLNKERNLKEMQRTVFCFLTAFAFVVLLAGASSAQQKFTAALNTIQEVPPPTNSLGRGNCMITLNLAQTQITATCQYSNLSSPLISGHIHCCAAPGANAPVLFNFNPPTGQTSGTFNAGPFNLTTEQLGELRAKRMYVNLHTQNFQGGEIRGQIKIQTTPYDNDGDGRTDIRVYRPSAFTTFGIFSVNNSIFSNFFGLAGETPTLTSSGSEDFDGDGRSDIVLISSSNNIFNWRILQTGSNSIRSLVWGINGVDDVVPGDYDGDGRTDVAVYRFENGVWYILQSSNNQLRAEFWGQAGNTNEFGMAGDFDGDGKNDLTTARGTSSGALWSTRRSSDNAIQTVIFGGVAPPARDFLIIPSAQIDVDRDGIQDRTVLRDPDSTNNNGSQMTYFVLRSSDNSIFSLPFGADTDSRFFGDYDGDGRTDFAVRRNEGGTLIWYIAQSSNNWNTAAPRVVRFGQTDDRFAPESDEDNPTLMREIKLEE